MRELDLIYGPESEIGAFYGREPGRALESGIESIMQKAGVAADRQQIVTTKLYNYCCKRIISINRGKAPDSQK